MKMIKTIFMASALTLGLTGIASAETAVIVSAKNANSVIDADTVSRIFLGKSKSFPDGSDAIPVDQPEESAIRTEFADKVLGKSASQLKAYWSKLVFTGKGEPPKVVESSAKVKALVAENPNLIGYIDAADVDGSVKVVHKF